LLWWKTLPRRSACTCTSCRTGRTTPRHT
jgi:hypothetical protein